MTGVSMTVLVKKRMGIGKLVCCKGKGGIAQGRIYYERIFVVDDP